MAKTFLTKCSRILVTQIYRPQNLGTALEFLYLFPWKSGRTCISSVTAERKGAFCSCDIDTNILFNNSYMDIPEIFQRLIHKMEWSNSYPLMNQFENVHDCTVLQLIQTQDLLWEAARLARRGAATWFSTMYSKRAPVALWPPSVSQYSGTIAELYFNNK